MINNLKKLKDVDMLPTSFLYNTCYFLRQASNVRRTAIKIPGKFLNKIISNVQTNDENFCLEGG